MSYPITWKPAAASNFAVGRNGQVPGWLVHHRMVGYLTGTDRHFAKDGVKVSTTLGIGRRTAGGPVEISQYVALDDRAFGNGNNVDSEGREVASEWNRLGYPSRPNEHTISIEHEDGGTSVDANGKRGVVDDEVIEASIWLDALLLSGDPDRVRAAGIRFRDPAIVRALANIPRDDTHIVDHHFIAGPLKPYCWQPWLDDPGFPQARYLDALAQEADMGEYVVPFNPIPFTIEGSARSFAAEAPYKELSTISGTVTVDATVTVVQTAVPHGPMVRVVTGAVGRRLIAAASGEFTVDCSGPVAAEHERTRQQAIAAVEAIP